MNHIQSFTAVKKRRMELQKAFLVALNSCQNISEDNICFGMSEKDP